MPRLIAFTGVILVAAAAAACGGGSATREPTSGPSPSMTEGARSVTETEATDALLANVYQTRWLDPGDDMAVKVEPMTIEQASAAANAEFGTVFTIAPKDRKCPPLSSCPYAGIPAETEGYLVIIRGQFREYEGPLGEPPPPWIPRRSAAAIAFVDWQGGIEYTMVWLDTP